jgi:hypothetical protein
MTRSVYYVLADVGFPWITTATAAQMDQFVRTFTFGA